MNFFNLFSSSSSSKPVLNVDGTFETAPDVYSAPSDSEEFKYYATSLSKKLQTFGMKSSFYNIYSDYKKTYMADAIIDNAMLLVDYVENIIVSHEERMKIFHLIDALYNIHNEKNEDARIQSMAKLLDNTIEKPVFKLSDVYEVGGISNRNNEYTIDKNKDIGLEMFQKNYRNLPLCRNMAIFETILILMTVSDEYRVTVNSKSLRIRCFSISFTCSADKVKATVSGEMSLHHFGVFHFYDCMNDTISAFIQRNICTYEMMRSTYLSYLSKSHLVTLGLNLIPKNLPIHFSMTLSHLAALSDAYLQIKNLYVFMDQIEAKDDLKKYYDQIHMKYMLTFKSLDVIGILNAYNLKNKVFDDGEWKEHHDTVVSTWKKTAAIGYFDFNILTSLDEIELFWLEVNQITVRELSEHMKSLFEEKKIIMLQQSNSSKRTNYTGSKSSASSPVAAPAIDHNEIANKKRIIFEFTKDANIASYDSDLLPSLMHWKDLGTYYYYESDAGVIAKLEECCKEDPTCFRTLSLINSHHILSGVDHGVNTRIERYIKLRNEKSPVVNLDGVHYITGLQTFGPWHIFDEPITTDTFKDTVSYFTPNEYTKLSFSIYSDTAKIKNKYNPLPDNGYGEIAVEYLAVVLYFDNQKIKLADNNPANQRYFQACFIFYPECEVGHDNYKYKMNSTNDIVSTLLITKFLDVINTKIDIQIGIDMKSFDGVKYPMVENILNKLKAKLSNGQYFSGVSMFIESCKDANSLEDYHKTYIDLLEKLEVKNNTLVCMFQKSNDLMTAIDDENIENNVINLYKGSVNKYKLKRILPCMSMNTSKLKIDLIQAGLSNR